MHYSEPDSNVNHYPTLAGKGCFYHTQSDDQSQWHKMAHSSKAEEDDWLKGLTIKLKNIAEKPIIFIEVSLRFPAVEDNPYGPEPGYVHDLQYGWSPISGSSVRPDHTAVMPNQTVDITLSEEDWQTINLSLAALGFSGHKTYVKMLLRTVVFDDKTMWRAGQILKQDPEAPGTWNVMSEKTSVRGWACSREILDALSMEE